MRLIKKNPPVFAYSFWPSTYSKVPWSLASLQSWLAILIQLRSLFFIHLFYFRNILSQKVQSFSRYNSSSFFQYSIYLNVSSNFAASVKDIFSKILKMSSLQKVVSLLDTITFFVFLIEKSLIFPSLQKLVGNLDTVNRLIVLMPWMFLKGYCLETFNLSVAIHSSWYISFSMSWPRCASCRFPALWFPRFKHQLDE